MADTMRDVFLYYSHTGSTEVVAKKLEETGVETRKVRPLKELPKSFFWSVMTGGFLAGLGVKSKLSVFDDDLSGYDRVFIGGPIWNDRLSCPINGLLARLDLKGKKVVFLLCSGSGKAGKATSWIQKHFPEAEVLVFKEPKKYPEELEKLQVLYE
ncbi:MAG: hypothetical protein K6E59_00620 [Bacilli bacterium]|nr:hypothetical protein [Bacilli bacterium]